MNELIPVFGRPLAVDSYLHRRNPSVKFGVLLVISALLMASFDPWTPTVLYLAALPAVRYAGKVPWRTVVLAQLPFGFFALSLFLVNAVTRPGTPIAWVGPFDVSAEGMSVGTSLAVRTLLVGTLSVAFVLSTDGARLMASLHQHVRLSPQLTYAVLAGYRLLEQLPEQWQTIRLAQAAREPRRAGGARRLPRSVRALRRAAFTTLVTTLRRGERMSIALETRGLGAGGRTVFRPVPLDHRDALFAVGTLGVVGAVIVVAWRAGWLVGWEALGVFG
ncbi:energy-coupling factor transporter transmembrane component T family protein [Georgenia faecalis]|uniref:energy-coupling factor transporter transmembrane component T family protein n=1 Tax=Georgenia faecalis TaxID=2483799 RepID=UPI0013E0B023|nr:energy-coupling factor transporter transmembrane component T [Georgenia faecalis]